MSESGVPDVATSDGQRVPVYSKRLAKHRAHAEALGARSRFISNFRGVSFLILTIGVMMLVFSDSKLVAAGLALGGGLVFVALILVHGRFLQREDRELRWMMVNKAALARCSDDWKSLPADGAVFQNPVHPYAEDLDVFGSQSLFQRINVAQTRDGRARLAEMLMNRADPAVVRKRQEAVQELTELLDLRQELEALAFAEAVPVEEQEAAKRSQSSEVNPDDLVAWAETESTLCKRVGLVWAARLLPLVVVPWVIYAFSSGLSAALWIAPLFAQTLLLVAARRETAKVFAAVSANQGVFLRFGPMLGLLETLKPNSPLLKELVLSVKNDDGVPPSVAMRDFEKAVGWFDLRHNGMVHPFVNGLLLWDIHCVLMLEKWQRAHGKSIRGWFYALGELEALSSLAGFAYDNPDYCWPEIEDGSVGLSAEGLAHPLLKSNVRISNDIRLEGPGRALLVTGSNMSGKSTLLRSLGVAVVLAFAGAPVCARGFRSGPLLVRTSMRISDSLGEGVSHFYAEVRKLKGVLEALGQSTPVLFLLDEILHGTNSRERQIGARWVLNELVGAGAMGAVSTHDEGLCELSGQLQKTVTLVHLRETVEGDKMTFDYKLRSGPVRSGNALRLMNMSGIPVPLEGTPSKPGA